MRKILYLCLLVYILLVSSDLVAQSKHEPNDVITLEADTTGKPYKKLLTMNWADTTC